ncbi:3224_t:CDS:2 [Entrophospora sp. SA101]|nr:3224_t:CDS:2 [Entrophospora sp. SA101]
MSEKNAHILCEKMKIEWNNLTIIRSSSFAHPHIFLQVHKKKKTKKEASYSQVVEEINKTSAGRHIVYCATPEICEDLKIYVTNEITNSEIGLYHGNLSGEEKHMSLMKWKTGNTKIIIATNAFGMGINTSDVYLIINFNFHLSLGQYIQESGRAGRDEDARENETLQRRIYLEQGLQSLSDIVSSSCGNCSNCQCRAVDNPSLINVTTDAIRVVDIIRRTIEELEEDNIIVQDDVIGIFLQLKNKKIIDKKLNSLSIYEENFDRTIWNSKQAFHLLDDLINKKIVVEAVMLKKTDAGFWISDSKITGVAGDAEEMVYSYSWDYYL